MRLEDLTIALRPRLPWEAVDLGCALVRRDYGRVLSLWLITVVPVWIIVAALLWDHPTWFGFAVWWLKPLYDRVPLYFLSRAAFGSRPTLKQCLREWPRLWSRFLFSALLWRRLSFIRSFALPVLMLEGQRGKAAYQRLKALATDGGSSGSSTTWVFIKLEIALYAGLLALASNLGPSSGLPDWSAIFEDPEAYFQSSDSQLWFSNILYLIAMTVMEPFYVGAGFGLYLNSRTKIEGWDIELVFRRLATRLRPVVVALLSLGLFLPSLISAQQPSRSPELKDRINQILREANGSSIPPATAAPATQESNEPSAETRVQEILAQPEFKEHSYTQKTWVNDEETKDSNSTGDIPASVALLLYIFAWGLVAALVGLLIWWVVRNRHLFGFSARLPRLPVEEISGPRVIMGMDIARESLPEDIVAAARAAWLQGHYREALSLLYRGSLSRLVESRRLPIRDSDTEDDCLLKVADLGEGAVTQFFTQLTLLWVRAAYAGKEAQEFEFAQLCQTWPFETTPALPRRQRLFTQTALALLSLSFLVGCDGRWEEITFPTGYKGKARTDPFLATQYLLQEYGHETERLPTLAQLPDPENGVIILSAEAGMPEARARQLLEWTRKGGHLIYSLAGCAPYNDWGLFSSASTFGYGGNDERADPVLEKLGVEMLGREGLKDALKKAFKTKTPKAQKATPPAKESTPPEDKPAPPPKDKPLPPIQDNPPPSADKPASTPAPADTPKRPRIQQPEDVPTVRREITMQGQTYAMDLPDQLHLKLDRRLRQSEWASGPIEKASALSLIHGYGRVTILNHARPLRNRYIDDNDHAAWLVDLMGEDSQQVQFIVSLQASFWSLLWNRAWMPLCGLGLVVIIWLWRHLPRFGPLQQVTLHDTKHFSQHIGALGQFFHRLRRDDLLLSAAAEAVRARAIRLYPHLIHHNDEAYLELLTQRTDLPPERIRAALSPAVKLTPHELVRLFQDLQTMRTALG